MLLEGQETGHAEDRGQRCSVCEVRETSRGYWRTQVGRMQMGHSPSVTEAGFLGLELTGLQEDVQGILKGTLLKQALALGTQRAVTSVCIPRLAVPMTGSRQHWGGRGKRQDTGTQRWGEIQSWGETARGSEKYTGGKRQQYGDPGTKRKGKSGR